MAEENQVKSVIDNIRKLGRVKSNIYSEEAYCDVEQFAYNENAAVLIRSDHGAKRLYFCYVDEQSLVELLGCDTAPEYSEAVIEFMTRDPEEFSDLLKQMGFAPIARMMRMSARDISQSLNNDALELYYNDTVGTVPAVSDTEEINAMLWKTFDTRISHLQSDEEIAESISRQEFTVHKNDEGRIDALLQAQVQPKKFYINQIVNTADKSVIHAMLQSRLRKYTDEGGKYVFAWVDRDNIASVKFHEKYGIKHDGMWNMVYAAEKQD